MKTIKLFTIISLITVTLVGCGSTGNVSSSQVEDLKKQVEQLKTGTLHFLAEVTAVVGKGSEPVAVIISVNGGKWNSIRGFINQYIKTIALVHYPAPPFVF